MDSLCPYSDMRSRSRSVQRLLQAKVLSIWNQNRQRFPSVLQHQHLIQ
jgi:hypothetical protein